MPEIDPVTQTFRWKDQYGTFHEPETMDTRHLFYTLRMIWNHSVPADWKVEPYREYRFPDFYTREYMRDAVEALAAVLCTRDDIAPLWMEELRHMAAKSERVRKLLNNVIQSQAATATHDLDAALPHSQ